MKIGFFIRSHLRGLLRRVSCLFGVWCLAFGVEIDFYLWILYLFVINYYHRLNEPPLLNSIREKFFIAQDLNLRCNRINPFVLVLLNYLREIT